MLNRIVAAALLVGLACPVLAGPILDQAAGLAGGKSGDLVYDGSTAKSAAPQVDGTLKTGDPLATAGKPASRPALTAGFVPTPPHDAPKKKDSVKRDVIVGLIGAAAAVRVGFSLGLIGGPIGAVVGALLGFAIGFFLSKRLLKKKA